MEEGLRLLGVSMQQLDAATGDVVQEQLSFDDATGGRPQQDRHDLERAVDRVRARFGDDALGPATLVGPRGLRTDRAGTAWGPDSEDDQR